MKPKEPATTQRAPRAGVPACCRIAGAVALSALTMGAARAQNVVRLPVPNSDFPISAAVTVKSGTDLVFLSGALAPVIDANAPKGSQAAYGDTATQTAGALERIKETLGRMGLGMGDVIKMTVFLAGDASKGGKMDFPGLMTGYTKYFGTKDQPNKPARRAGQGAALAAPGALVEIEVIAAKPH